MKVFNIIFFYIVFIQIAVGQTDKKEVNSVLDRWHNAASDADFNVYFDLMDDSSIFIGTDPTERWNKEQFMNYAKPYFDKGKAWNFTSLERNVDFSEDGKTAWIDELLSTQMKICRGSGVLIKKDSKWLIKHYVLSITVPNDLIDQIVPLKSEIEDKLIKDLQNK